MGDFCGTCMISNLPIQIGDRVKLIFIKPSYKNNFKHLSCSSGFSYPTGIFSPQFLPIEGEYNGAGSIENIK